MLERLLLFFKVKKHHLKDQLHSIFFYYPKSLKFLAADLLLGFFSLFYNPYHHCKKKGDLYGETPLITLHRITQFIPISIDDVWLELGSGRGKSCFWISQFIGCKTIGVEKSALFVKLAQVIQKIVSIPNLSFQKMDQKEADFEQATIVYFYSTIEKEEELQKIVEKMKKLPLGAHIITISSFLPKAFYLEEEGSFPVVFPWGKTEAFIMRKI